MPPRSKLTGFSFQNALIVLLGASFAVVLFLMLNASNKQATQSALLQAARTYSETFTGFRNFYQQTVVKRVADTDVIVTHDFLDQDNAIPIPATMMLELSAYLNTQTENITFALVSDYPFPWRERRFLTDFDKRALESLRSNAADEYYEIFSENGLTYLHFASPVYMTEGCIDCHNNHPDSPKQDWKVGDIRAVQIFEMPVDDAIRTLDFETSAIAATIAFIGVSTVFALLFLNQRASQAQLLLRREAYFDVLTGAMRRQRFQEAYDIPVRDKEYYLFLADVDDFKSFNTNFGHTVGDVVLAKTVSNIDAAMPEAEVICRFGGEEFLLLIPVSRVGKDPADYFDRAVSFVAKQEIHIKNHITRCTISAGYIKLNRSDDLIKAAEKADTALRYAKRTGKNRAMMADQDLLARLGYMEENYKLADVVSAIEAQEFEFFFQPIVDLQTREPIGYEALVRWQPEGREPIPPASYLPQYVSALRDPNLASHIRTMVRRSIPPLTESGKRCTHLSFNYDPYDLLADFESNALTPVLRELVAEGYKISIEVTETPYLQDASPEQVRAAFTKIVDLGFSLHLDDFGKDGSGIERLASHYFSVVKADRSLIAELESSERKRQMMSLIVELTASVGAQLTVEGVESEAERQILLGLGVKYAQGYLFGRPQSFSNA